MQSSRVSREGELLVGKYQLQRLLGTGGMGEVYLAENTLIQRLVAIKMLLPEHGANEQIVGRFLREARAANIVRHPNVVDVLDIGQDEGGAPFIVQEFLEGQDLDEILTELRGTLPVPAAVELLLPIVDAIGYAHTKGVVHRDLKPANVFLARIGDRVVPKVLDFGIARFGEDVDARRMTATGLVMGTPAYMSPELVQHGARAADARSDVWALGVMLYEVFAGRLPFDAEAASALFVKICTEEAPPLSETAPHLPVELARVITKSLAKDPQQRYASAAALADDLRAAMGGERVPAPEDARPALGQFVEQAVARASRRPQAGPAAASGGSGVANTLTDMRASPAHQAAVAAAAAATAVPDLEVQSARRARSDNQALPLRQVAARAPLGSGSGAGVADSGSHSVSRRGAQASRRDDDEAVERAGLGDALDFLILLTFIASSAALGLLGEAGIRRVARLFPEHGSTALGAVAAGFAVAGLAVVVKVTTPGLPTAGALLVGGGALVYAAIVGFAAVRIAGIADLPDLTGVVAQATLVAIGLGTVLMSVGRAYHAWTRQRSVVFLGLFLVASVGAVALVLVTGATVLGYR